MEYESILFLNDSGTSEEPGYFKDLNIDQIVQSITASKKEYDLKPFFFTHLSDRDKIYRRQKIMKDLEMPDTMAAVKTFAFSMKNVSSRIGSLDKLYFKHHREGWFLDTAERYAETIISFEKKLSSLDLRSEGLCSFRNYLKTYTVSVYFTEFLRSIAELRKGLACVMYSVFIKGNVIKVSMHQDKPDYSRTVESIFSNFKDESEPAHIISENGSTRMNHIEAEILSMVAKLHPEVFNKLELFAEHYSDFIDDGIKRFNREIQFYISLSEYISQFRLTGLPFCYPEIANSKKDIFFKEGFDLSLAQKLFWGKTEIVCNDFSLEDGERIFIVTGANQGGKTTFARTFGQIHYMAALGSPVPGSEARIYSFDTMFTHFEKEEDISNLKSRLEDDLSRLHDILTCSTERSILILNETLSSTTLYDTKLLGEKILQQITDKDAICMWITFADELSVFNSKTVSMITEMVPHDHSERTYRIIRGKADGAAYAMMLAEKNSLTYRQIIRRIK